MKLLEALELANAPFSGKPQPGFAALACGFSPLHLKTLVSAYLRQTLPGRAIELQTGLYGDLAGTLEKLHPPLEFVLLVVEWADLDARLGLRTTASWDPEVLPEINRDACKMLRRLQAAVDALASFTTVAICLPTLPLPPLSFRRRSEADELQLGLREQVNKWAMELSVHPSVAVVSPAELDRVSPLPQRHDVRAELSSGFPYHLSHADHLARMLVEVAAPPPAKKGLITDLDDTVWRGVVGDDGVQAICWDLDHNAHIHGIYQQLLNALIKSGVLVGVVSNNDLSVIKEAAQRSDFILDWKQLYPIEATRGPKSGAVGRTLNLWNIGPESVVFVDDNPLEIAEVKSAFPAIECVLFPKQDAVAALGFFYSLRNYFGKRQIREEDQVRGASIRSSQALRKATEDSTTNLETILREAKGEITFLYDKAALNGRALELINKTNQFNLNGRRHTAASWSSLLADPESWVQVTEYQDRFARLGKIAVLAGRKQGKRLTIDTWVMSCRAFSRRIEHHCLKDLMEHFGAEEAAVNFVATERNRPMRDFLANISGDAPESQVVITRRMLKSKYPPLYHRKHSHG